ncbi:hypothetical protein P9J64_12740 [Deltaproteobacteria bacterium IMCC39524]|nr:hypothetical protein [Deltaproteobacteria bacterium IMCC39524]
MSKLYKGDGFYDFSLGVEREEVRSIGLSHAKMVRYVNGKILLHGFGYSLGCELGWVQLFNGVARGQWGCPVLR